MLPPSRKGSFQPLDPLSNLPPEIIANILSQLPIREAIQTCILSHQWSYKWCSMTRLVFGNDSDALLDDDSDTWYHDVFVNFVDRVLLYHRGPVQELTIATEAEPDISDLNRWVYIASRNDVRKLSLHFGCGIMAPSSLYQCSKLVSLHIGSCKIQELPFGFEGFMYLKTLRFDGLAIPGSSLEKLISGCPVLEILKIYESYVEVFRVHAPLLKYMYLDGTVEGFFLEKTPRLRELSVTTDGHSVDARIGAAIKFCGHVPSLEKLMGRDYFMKSRGEDATMCAVTHEHLRFIDLYLNFEDPTEVLHLLKLMDRSPVLEDICLRARGRGTPREVALGSEFWSRAHDAGCEFLQLKNARIIARGSTDETEFMKLLLLNSSALEEMCVCLPPCTKDWSNREVVDKLLRCRRASRLAKVVVGSGY